MAGDHFLSLEVAEEAVTVASAQSASPTVKLKKLQEPADWESICSVAEGPSGS